MNDPVSTFISDEDTVLIEEAVRAAEKRTAGEIVVMVVASSDNYPLANILGGLVFGFLLSISISLATDMQSMWNFLGFFLPSFVLCNEIIRRNPSLKRLFVTASDMGDEVEDAAFSAFYKKEVWNTRNHTGILIFISLFEHRVWVLGDKGINAKVNPSVWREITDGIVAGIRGKSQVSALCDAIDRCGAILEGHFPPGKDNPDELDNSVIRGH